jgi:2-polyprenyl-3-methyl-5-hydroxy-6-metoxy-1,4-benzoquinol methylase
MGQVPAIPPKCLHAMREGHAEYRRHEFAFEIFPIPFGNARLLDVGCGGGGVAVKANGMGWEVTGIDIAPRNVGSLRTKGFRAEKVDLNGLFLSGTENSVAPPA